jgi:hypothetical protein
MLKKCQVVMLPTNEKSKLVLSFKEKSFNQLTEPKLILIEEANYQLSNIQSHHLYILSDDKINGGDWVYNSISKEIYQFIENHVSYESKIIATTDSSLGAEPNELYPEWNRLRLPQPSQSFIEKYLESYNKGNIITDVLVEYENPYVKLVGNKIGSNIGYFTLTEENKWKLKVNPKDNTITIKQVKDNWSREQVVSSVLKMQHDFTKYKENFMGGPNMREIAEWTNNWIEENL